MKLLEIPNPPPNFLLAQQIALSDSVFTFYVQNKIDKKKLFNEIFGVYPARPGDVKLGTAFLPGTLARVEMYNYAFNLTTVGIVDIFTQKVLSVTHYPQTQPDLPKRLVDLATTIAINSPEVEKALGFKPSMNQAIMSSTRTALNKTKCERSMHLCVAPTFVQGTRALWAIVDLTDNRVVGVRWTNTGEDSLKTPITERRLQNENIADCFCDKVNQLNKYGWKMDYLLTSSDGLMISNVQFGPKRILNSAKLVDWHVSYSGTEGFGYSDAVGCPIFSQSAVVATEPPQIYDLVEGDSTVGFVLEQKYFSELWPAPCNYSYSQRYFFYKDGRFRVSCASIGRGCGNNGTYRPVFRIAFAGNQQNFFEWQEQGWKPWTKEGWRLQNSLTQYDKNGSQYRINTNGNEGYYIQPGQGQFKDGGRGDNAYFYVTKHHLDKDEGATDMLTIGPCCNTDYQQGPEKFIDPKPENIQQTDLVLWYVPQMKNDDTPGSKYCWSEAYYEDGIYKIRAYPCFAGPLFVPTKK
ncbi:MAG: hypothetical protein B7Y69_11975 [Sphingobacteriia bacterium 35-40-8]|nr:MAG: hypothetical protein B7Y69_11975 [Sphingobacteriia bacterium 35-40-8]